METQNFAPKNLYFVLSNKGGVGKSTLVYLLASKYGDYQFFDFDEATLTSYNRLKKSVNCIKLSFRDNDSNELERSLMDNFFSIVSKGKKENNICDFSGTLSESLINYFNDYEIDENFKTMLTNYNINLRLIIILAGGALFAPTFNYLLNVLPIANKKNIEVKIFCNRFYRFNEIQRKDLDAFLLKSNFKGQTIDFTISNDTSTYTQTKIISCLNAGTLILDIDDKADPSLFFKCKQNLDKINLGNDTN